MKTSLFTILVSVVKRPHDQGNSNKRNLIGGLLTVLEMCLCNYDRVLTKLKFWP